MGPGNPAPTCSLKQLCIVWSWLFWIIGRVWESNPHLPSRAALPSMQLAALRSGWGVGIQPSSVPWNSSELCRATCSRKFLWGTGKGCIPSAYPLPRAVISTLGRAALGDRQGRDSQPLPTLQSSQLHATHRCSKDQTSAGFPAPTFFLEQLAQSKQGRCW